MLSLALVASALSASAKTADDPVLMTVAGRPVTLSEFEYLYTKNNQQQATPQTLDEYVDMFTVYKLKVADAYAAGVDTTASFIKEFNGYRNDLAAPYLRDEAVDEQLLKDAYAHRLENVQVDHLMLPLSPEGKQTADSLRQAIAAGADFMDAVVKYSIDPSKQYNNGHLGWITANTYPYPFEEAAYNTPVGELSPVTATRYGYHVLRVTGRRPDKGEVLVSHILKLFPSDRNEQTDAAVKAAIDSVYTVVTTPGTDFGEVASRESEDPGSARNKGQLPWFGAGRMVPEFENVSFALADGEISKPFASQFGYHIVKRFDSRHAGSFDEERNSLSEAIKADPERAERASMARLAQLKKEHKAVIDTNTLELVRNEIRNHGAFDSTLVAGFASWNQPMLTAGTSSMSVAEYFARKPIFGTVEVETAYNRIDAGTAEMLDEMTLEAEKQRLESTNREFKNLVNEYRDGMMLFEVSNNKVWERSSKDIEGLTAYFKAHADKYAFDAPRYKGFLISATTDSVAKAVDSYLTANTVNPDSLGVELRRMFPRNIKVERVVLPAGSNQIVDAVAFGAPAPDLSGNTRWKAYTTYMGRLINAPEEVADVRGAVTSDYQNELEQQWIKEIRAKYPVKINKKVLKKLK